MKKLFEEFRKFINKGNALSLAIGVILGASFTAIVSAINTKIISPLIGLLLGEKDLAESLITVLRETADPVTGEVTTTAIYWGAFIQAVIDFLLTAIVLFLIFKLSGSFTNVVKKANDMETRIKFKKEMKIKLTKKELAFLDKKAKEEAKKAEEDARKAEEEKNKVYEPTFEEQQLALLKSINEQLIKYNEREKIGSK